MASTVRVNLYFRRPGLLRRLDKLAKKLDSSRNRIVRLAVTEFISKYEGGSE